MTHLPLAAFTFGDGLLTVLEIAFMLLWIWIAFGVIYDIFRSQDLTNGRKALWVFAIILLPYIGVLLYLIIRGSSLHEHQAHDQALYAAFRQYQRTGRSAGVVDDMSRLADLRDRGVLTSGEFDQAKARALA